MIRYLVLFTGFGLTYSAFADDVAQELTPSAVNNISIPGPEMDQDRFIPALAVQNHYGSQLGGPVVVLPVPLPGSGTSGSNSTYGFQYPGSYMPRDTPLHRFSGYIVCDPPKPTGGATATASESAGTPSVRRMAKITTTRSLAAPAYSQPCPIYTLDGQIQKNNDSATGTSH